MAALYGPSEISAKVGDDKQKVTIVERTDYPFSEEIEFEIQTEGKVSFPLQLVSESFAFFKWQANEY